MGFSFIKIWYYPNTIYLSAYSLKEHEQGKEY